ncbi:MAG TPA: AI-2E family transporter [Nevskiaceae bacterium]|nr:AI-2E family transporter [Nevskiaceae bacterium]
MSATSSPPDRVEVSALVLTGIALIAVLKLHLLAALLTGLLVYESVHLLTPVIRARLNSRRGARLVAVMLLTAVILALITAAVFGAISFFRYGGINALLQKLAEIIENSRDMLPVWSEPYLPESAEELRGVAVHWLREHAAVVQGAGTELGRSIAYVLIAMIIGALLSLQEEVGTPADQRPLARALKERVRRFGNAFRRVVLAQGWISALNTGLTWLYLAVALPLCGVHLPLVKTLLLLTFVVGLLPVVGNLISNSAIVIVSFSQGMPVAIASLTFLVVTHKLAYFLNARIIGSKIQARAWEILVAMLVMEATFGIGGLVAAPIYYAYLKDELSARGLV